jgi:hypothetical protein
MIFADGFESTEQRAPNTGFSLDQTTLSHFEAPFVFERIVKPGVPNFDWFATRPASAFLEGVSVKALCLAKSDLCDLK